VLAPLSQIAAAAAQAEVASPAIVVVGEVVRLRAALGDLALASADAGHALPAHTRDGNRLSDGALVR